MNLGPPNKCRTLKGFGNEVLFPLVNTVGWSFKKSRILKFSKNGPIRSKNGPKWSINNPRLAISGQNWSKIGPKLVQTCSKIGPKLVQNWSKIGPKLVQKWSK